MGGFNAGSMLGGTDFMASGYHTCLMSHVRSLLLVALGVNYDDP